MNDGINGWERLGILLLFLLLVALVTWMLWQWLKMINKKD